jgi:hypothetical protein
VVARARDDVGGGMGLFTTCGIEQGAVVWAEPRALQAAHAVPRSRAWIEALSPLCRKAYCHFMYQTGEDEYSSLPEFDALSLLPAPDDPSFSPALAASLEDYPSMRPADISSYMNHSCDPSTAFSDGGEEYVAVMVATRDLAPGDELTYEYATSENCDLCPAWECSCGAPRCRRRVTHADWRLSEVHRLGCAGALPNFPTACTEITLYIPTTDRDRDRCTGPGTGTGTGTGAGTPSRLSATFTL